jgi:opacity protein-like surface antigen
MKRLALLCGAFLLFAGVSSAQDFSKIEAFGGYSYLRANDFNTGFNYNGGSGSLAYNFTPMLGVVADFGGYHWSGGFDDSGNVDSTVVTYLFGPKIALRHGPLTPFAQVLFGGAHASGSLEGGCESDARVHSQGGCENVSGSENAFAMTIGGGVDWNATSHIGIRLIQAEYLLTRFSSFENEGNNSQNNARISAGVVFRF